MNENNYTKIKVLQFMYGNMEYFQWSERINRCYCLRHGYEYVISHETPRQDRHLSWHRLLMILEEFHDCDYLLFMDADAHFYSHELTIENELIPLMEGKDILMAQDISCEKIRWNPGLPNAGVILLKVNDHVREFIEYWDKALEINESTRWDWPVEQLALWLVVLPKFPEMIKIHDEYYLIQGYHGLYIRHYMTMPDSDRKKRMQEFCELRKINH